MKTMKLISQNGGNDYIERTYEYRGYIIEETRYCEEDCNHHIATVLLDNNEVAQFNWNDCIEQAQQFIDEREDN